MRGLFVLEHVLILTCGDEIATFPYRPDIRFQQEIKILSQDLTLQQHYLHLASIPPAHSMQSDLK